MNKAIDIPYFITSNSPSNKFTVRCKRKCVAQLPKVIKLELYGKVRGLHTKDEQDTYLQNLDTQGCRAEEGPVEGESIKRKPHSSSYKYLYKFLNTLDIDETMLRNKFKKTNSEGFIVNDLRDKHGKRAKVYTDTQQFIRDHIQSIPKVESHYLRTQ